MLYFRVSWEDPLSFELKGGLNLYTTTPPGSGAVVGGILRILDQFNHDSEPMAIYRFVEATKFAFAQRSKLGDWMDSDINQSVNETVQYIQSSDWLKWLLEKWNDTQTNDDTEYYGADFQYVPTDHGTSHVSILAPNGDAVSVTSTVNTYFGSGNHFKIFVLPLCSLHLQFALLKIDTLNLLLKKSTTNH